MSARLQLKIACDPFESVRALCEKTIVPHGIDLHVEPEMSNPVRHSAMVRDMAFDVCELNVCTYLMARDAGVALTAIPVFLFRKFRHGNIFVNPRSGITRAAQLAGGRIGCPSLQPASNVWIHGILQDEGELNPRHVHWMRERAEDVPFDPPADLKVEQIAAGRTAVDLLLAGEIEAVTTPQTPQALLDGDPRIARLYPDYVARERAYFERTGLFPIMHVTALPSDLVRREPWIVGSLIAAFEASKRLAAAHFVNVRVATLAWFGAQWEEEARLFGADAWPHGLTDANRRNLETIIRYTHEQGLIGRRYAIDDLFTPA